MAGFDPKIFGRNGFAMNLRRHFLTGILIAILILSLQVFGQAPAPQQAPPTAPTGTIDNPVRLNVSVDMVNIPAIVRDTSGRYVDGLKQDDFKVLENGVEQKLSFFAQDSLANLSVGVLIDTSGSMRHKLQQALQMVREVSLALGPQDEMFLMTFADDVDLRQKFTKNPEDISKALRGIRSGGETSVYDAIQLGVQEMKNAKNGKRILLQKPEEGVYAEGMMIVVGEQGEIDVSGRSLGPIYTKDKEARKKELIAEIISHFSL